MEGKLLKTDKTMQRENEVLKPLENKGELMTGVNETENMQAIGKCDEIHPHSKLLDNMFVHERERDKQRKLELENHLTTEKHLGDEEVRIKKLQTMVKWIQDHPEKCSTWRKKCKQIMNSRICKCTRCAKHSRSRMVNYRDQQTFTDFIRRKRRHDVKQYDSLNGKMQKLKMDYDDNEMD